MSKENYNKPNQDQPLVLPPGELSQKFRILSTQEVEDLGLSKHKSKSLERNSEGSMSLERAKEIMGTDFLGPDAVERTFGFFPQVVPLIQFTESDLERAKELDQFLILRVDQTTEGRPLTMDGMYQMLQPEFTAKGDGKILKSHGDRNSWYKYEDFIHKDTPRLSWALVGKGKIPNASGIDFLTQTEIIADYLKTDIFRNQEIPEVYQEAIAEFEAKKAAIQAMPGSSWREIAKHLTALKLNQLTRQLPVEIMYDFLMYFKNNGKRLLEGQYTWTFRCDSNYKVVSVGHLDVHGAEIDNLSAVNPYNLLGVVFSRRL